MATDNKKEQNLKKWDAALSIADTVGGAIPGVGGFISAGANIGKAVVAAKQGDKLGVAISIGKAVLSLVPGVSQAKTAYKIIKGAVTAIDAGYKGYKAIQDYKGGDKAGGILGMAGAVLSCTGIWCGDVNVGKLKDLNLLSLASDGLDVLALFINPILGKMKVGAEAVKNAFGKIKGFFIKLKDKIKEKVLAAKEAIVKKAAQIKKGIAALAIAAVARFSRVSPSMMLGGAVAAIYGPPLQDIFNKHFEKEPELPPVTVNFNALAETPVKSSTVTITGTYKEADKVLLKLEKFDDATNAFVPVSGSQRDVWGEPFTTDFTGLSSGWYRVNAHATHPDGREDKDIYEFGVEKRVELLKTKEVAEIQTKRETKEVVDLLSGKSFNVSWAASATYHSDWTPMTSADTAVIKSILNPAKKADDNAYWGETSSWNWNARPGVLKLNGRLIAVGYHFRPHANIMGGSPGSPLRNPPEGNNGPPWTMGGHMCMYYGDSPGGTPKCNDAAREAYKIGL